jgi:FixH
MNWGTKITVLYLGFVALILSLVFTCFGQKTELESKDYYAKELQFQNQINATSNANGLLKPLEHLVNGKSVLIKIPSELLTADFKGEVEFIRPSDSSKDLKLSLMPNTIGEQTIKDPSFIKGVYKMKISIESHGKNYFEESAIYFE